MKLKRYHFFIIVLVGFLGMQFFLLSRAPAVTALPPRPTATAMPQPESVRAGGFIELFVEGFVPNVWTLVQWQDGQGEWHDVDGWQGELDEGSHKTWWVDEADLGTGPFRWVVLGEDDLTAISAPFNLPTAANEKVTVTILLD